MVSIQEAKQQIENQRKLIAQRKIEAEEAKRKLEEQKKRLPKPTQKSLRGGMFDGLEGRKRRRVVEGAEEQLKVRKEQINLYKQGLEEYEREVLNPTEKQINEVEKAQRRAKQYNYAVRVYLGLTSGARLSNVPEDIKKEAKKYAEERERNALNVSWNLNIPTVTNISNKQGISFDPLSSKGTYYAGSGTYVSPEGYGMSVAEIPKGAKISFEKDPYLNSSYPQKSSSKPPKISQPRNLSLTELKKEWTPLKQTTKKINNLTSKPFLTAGSPKKFTPLNGSKPKRGYESIEASKKVKTIKANGKSLETPKSKKDIFQPKSKKKSKEEDFLLGDGIISKSSKKGKKKINLWGS